MKDYSKMYMKRKTFIVYWTEGDSRKANRSLIRETSANAAKIACFQLYRSKGRKIKPYFVELLERRSRA